jgi:hypothetical protein
MLTLLNPGTNITLTAVPNTGSVFVGWSGACTGTGTCSIVMNANKSVSAGFETIINGVCGKTNNTCTAGNFIDKTDTTTQYLWTCAGMNGGTSASCMLNKPVNGLCGTTTNTCITGTFVDLTDTIPYYKWSCAGMNGGTTASCSKIMSGYYTLTAKKVGYGTIYRGTTVFSSGIFRLNTTITLTAKPATGYSFVSWSGCNSVSGSTCTVSMSANKTVIATFK